MERLYLLLIVLIPVISMYILIIAKVTMSAPVAMILFGIVLVSFAHLKFSKEKH